jgi:hypothetical protein
MRASGIPRKNAKVVSRYEAHKTSIMTATTATG